MGLFNFFFKNRKNGTDVSLSVTPGENPGDFSADLYEISSCYDFVSRSAHALEVKGDAEKLRGLLDVYPGFRSFVKDAFRADGELPPLVPCRDVLPELLMRFGRWAEAEGVIRECISLRAYGHTEYRDSRDHNGFWVEESGDAEIKTLRLRRAVADGALAFLTENPGVLQSKIYKQPSLSGLDHDALVWFCRSSHQIRKVKAEKTNKLYPAEMLE